MSALTKENLRHLEELSRLELRPEEEDRFLKDLQKILDYFEELQKLDTSKIEPMTGGIAIKNKFREDEASLNTNQGSGKEQFPETEHGYLAIPPVFN